MLVKKQELIEWLMKNGDEAKAWDIEGPHFPQGVDTEKDRELLRLPPPYSAGQVMPSR